MNTTTATLPERKTFIKMAPKKVLSDYLKEAKRVKYTIEKNDLTAKVTDPDNGDALVFRSVIIRPGLYAMTFSKAYWQEPALPA